MKLIALPVAIALSLLCAATASAEFCKEPSSGNSSLITDKVAHYLSTPSGKTIECTFVRSEDASTSAAYTCGGIDISINTDPVSLEIFTIGGYRTYPDKKTSCLMETPNRTEQLQVFGSNEIEFSFKSITIYKHKPTQIDQL